MAILRPSRIFGLVNQDETTAEGDVATWDAARSSYEPRPPSGGSMVAHDIVGGYHTGAGLTAGHVLRASAPTVFTFAAIQDADIPATIARDTEVTAAVSAHAGAADPHPGYSTDAEVTAAIAAHSGAADPHPTYTTAAEAASAAAAAVTTHEGAADPHAGYQKESEKAAANGYASLGADGLVPSAQLPAGGSDPYHARLVLASDKPTGANVTPVTLGLTFSFAANSKYVVDIYALVAPTAATTGCGFMIDVSAAVTYVGTHVTHQLAAAGTLSGATSVGDMAATLSGVSSGMPATASYPVIGGGILITGANAGTATFFFRAEVAAVTTCKAGSMFLVTKVA